jgi:hypothetical protein
VFEVWQAQHEVLYAIAGGDMSPEDGLAKLVEVTEAAIAQ